jgi:hypothetical protein
MSYGVVHRSISPESADVSSSLHSSDSRASQFAADFLSTAGPSSGATRPLLGQPMLEIAPREPNVLAHTHVRKSTDAARLVDPRDFHREQLRRFFRAQQRLAQTDPRRQFHLLAVPVNPSCRRHVS